MQPGALSEQTTLPFADPVEPSLLQKHCVPRAAAALRPIHYLGSKLRIVDLIREVIDRVDPSGGPVCDLFAGSGTVSRELAASRKVIAVDIQEYSRVLCSALLYPHRLTKDVVEHFLSRAFSSEHSRTLSWTIEPITTYETSCQRLAAAGNVEPLCRLLEQGSIISFQRAAGNVGDAMLRAALEETLARLRQLDLAESPSSMAIRYFGGVYFSYAQASQLDMLLEAVATRPQTDKNLFLAAVLSTASAVVNTVGRQFAQPIRPRRSDGKPKPYLAQRVARDRSVEVRDVFATWIGRYQGIQASHRGHQVIRGDYADALDAIRGQVGVVYADPPYTRDHYSRYYHVLETLCLRDCPPISTVRIAGREQLSRGIYRTERHQSPFCIKSRAPQAFSTLFTKARCLNVPLVVSYSPFEKSSGARPRLMTIKDIAELAQRSFRQVTIVPAGRIAHSKLNRADMNKSISYGAETFLVCIA